MAQAKAAVIHNREERNAQGTMMTRVASFLICKGSSTHPVSFEPTISPSTLFRQR
jgi:hypothetical protein